MLNFTPAHSYQNPYFPHTNNAIRRNNTLGNNTLRNNAYQLPYLNNDELTKDSLEIYLAGRGIDDKEIKKIIALGNDKNGDYNPTRGSLIREIADKCYYDRFDNSDINSGNINKILNLITDKNGNEIKACSKIFKTKFFGIPSQEHFQTTCFILENLRDKNGVVDDERVKLTNFLIDELRFEDSSDVKNDIKTIFGILSDKKGNLNKKATELYIKINRLRHNIHIENDANQIICQCKTKNGSFSDKKLKFTDKIITDNQLCSADSINQIIEFCTNEQGQIDMQYYPTAIELSKGFDSKALTQVNDFKSYLNLNRISELNFRQKRDLLEKALEYGENTYSSTITKYSKGKLLPRNNDSYLYMISKLSGLLGLNVKELSNNEKNSYFTAIDNLDNPQSAFYNADLDNTSLQLTYPKEKFIKDVENITKNLSENDRRQVFDYYSFEILNDGEGHYTLNGFPNISAADTSTLTAKQYQAVNNIKPLVENFTSKNHLTVSGNKQLEKELNSVLFAFPEFYTIIGKKQHKTHDYTLDIHTLKVLQEVIKNPYYKNLSKSNQRMLKACALLHDISKEENDTDKKHPIHSALDAFYLTSKLGYSYHSKLKIYQLIKNHDWLGRYAQKKVSAKDVAFELRQDDSFKMSSILTASDLKAVKKNDEFYKKHAEFFKKSANEIQYYVDSLKKTAIHLPQTKLPKANEVPPSKYVKKETYDGITNTVIYVNPDLDLSKVGFENVSDVNDLNLLLHALDNKDQASMFQVLGNLDSEALLSTSYMTYSQKNFKVFRKQGFILKVASDDIHVAYFRDFGSGYKKNLNTLKSEYLFKDDNIYRNYISSLIKKKMNLSDAQYVKMFSEIENKPIEVLRKTNPKFAKVMTEIFSDMEGHKRNNGRQYNEILVTRPQIQGVFCYGKKVEEMPKCLRKYAAEHNVPILKFCDTDKN